MRRNDLPRPFLKWVGGKGQLLPELLDAVAAAGDFRTYHEPFIGGGALFFALARMKMLPNGAHLSDINPNLLAAYIGVRDDVDGVLRALADHERRHSESYFYEIRASKPRSPARKAARIIYLNRTCFNGLYRENSKGQFNVPFGRYANPRICNEHNLRAVAATLANARVHTRTFEESLADIRAGDLVYFDPPYIPLSSTAYFTAYSKNKFGRVQQEQLAEAFSDLANRGVKVIASNSDTEFTDELYADHYTHRVEATRNINSKVDRRGPVGEVIISSFPIAAPAAGDLP